MTYIIEVEEKVSTIHQILVEVEDESQLDEALERAEETDCFDDYVYAVGEMVEVLEINRGYMHNDSSVEYYDCREAKNLDN